MRRGSWIALLAMALLSTGCAYRYKFETGLPPSDEKVTEWRHFFFWGWSRPAPLDLERTCPDGAAEFGSYVSFLNWPFAVLTAGFYSPRTVYAIQAATHAEVK